jgi:hypothetical protein
MTATATSTATGLDGMARIKPETGTDTATTTAKRFVKSKAPRLTLFAVAVALSASGHL